MSDSDSDSGNAFFTDILTSTKEYLKDIRRNLNNFNQMQTDFKGISPELFKEENYEKTLDEEKNNIDEVFKILEEGNKLLNETKSIIDDIKKDISDKIKTGNTRTNTIKGGRKRITNKKIYKKRRITNKKNTYR